MKNKLFAEAYEQYKKGFSLQEVGNMYSISRQSVYSAFKLRGYELRKKKVLPFIIYDEIKWTPSMYGYYRATSRRKNLFLHRYIWEKENGEIPPGHDLHHKDGNRANNDISNLECLTKSEHTRKYSPHHNQYTHVKN
jgi:hypothetical protein